VNLPAKAGIPVGRVRLLVALPTESRFQVDEVERPIQSLEEEEVRQQVLQALNAWYYRE